MRCPACDDADSRVVDSRTTGDAVRRRRECLACGERFTTHERPEKRVLWVIKKDGRREPFTRGKVLHGLALACRKRPVDDAKLDEVAREVEHRLESRRESDIPVTAVGEAVMAALLNVDEVAYVRFASVYRAFESVEQFIDAIHPLRVAEPS
ncbi:MAG: transcriptional repressor NrdR [Myxococcota bacterium]|jgi:transcriptional repressor NrdR